MTCVFQFVPRTHPHFMCIDSSVAAYAKRTGSAGWRSPWLRGSCHGGTEVKSMHAAPARARMCLARGDIELDWEAF